VCEEGSLPFVSFFDANVVVSPSNIEFGEEGAAAKLIHYFCDEGRYIAVLFSPFVDWVVVLYES
jgi:hypothetical protein